MWECATLAAKIHSKPSAGYNKATAKVKAGGGFPANATRTTYATHARKYVANAINAKIPNKRTDITDATTKRKLG